MNGNFIIVELEGKTGCLLFDTPCIYHRIMQICIYKSYKGKLGNLFYFDIVLLVDLAVKAPKKACLKVKLMKNSVLRKNCHGQPNFLYPKARVFVFTSLCQYF